MSAYPQSLTNLIKSLSGLPGIGEKTAARLAMHILNGSKEAALTLADSIIQVKEKIHFCSICFNYADQDPCHICSGLERDKEVICVVETPDDLIALENAGVFKGTYHVLGGALSPLQGLGPEDIRIGQLIGRIKEGGVTEVIIATNPTLEGETTAAFIADQLKDMSVSVTRIASGIPMGGDIKYTDAHTIKRSLQYRTKL
ncbi:MAG: recombination protein RecR [Deltaproteobacteria bacterium]|nr:recombination protein RecR [Deltaproteobacteria bacterium]